MEFALIFEWVDGELDCEQAEWFQQVKWFDTKEGLLNAYREAQRRWADMISAGRMYLSGAVHCSWADIERIF
jgi:hypothetical protein